MDLIARFAATLAAQAGAGDDGHLLPGRLARAAAEALGVDGAGLSLLATETGRSPLGASSPDAARAERLEFTVGTGPCLLAHETGQPVFVVEEDIRRRWPVYADLLLEGTPFRGIVSLPLRSPLTRVGAMNLFFVDAADVPRLDVFAALTVGDLVNTALCDALVRSAWTAESGPDWLHSPPARRRAVVWTAVDRTSGALDVDAPAALALLRGYSYSAGRSVDSVAADLVSGRLRPADVLGGPGEH
ncbi:GAF domain-containing protein [Modestobacter excelsi]|uniref:GAF domain-containing protein n=1 Tax=Modestobacter excelsi TaxID=2213161 RepID=UPI00110D1EBF|nr:GAF domain-containing protein [Modestobacter excelsi]